MTYSEFAHSRPVLYGQMTMNGKCKIGSFRLMWSRYTNAGEYHYITPAGNIGSGGFTLMRAYQLFNSGQLSTNPENGNPNNYVN